MLTNQEVTSITLTSTLSTATPRKGVSFILKAYTEPEASSVTFQSSNPAVLNLEVDDTNDYTEYGSCLVNVLAAGTAKIRVRAGDISEYLEYTCEEEESDSESSSVITIDCNSMVELNTNYITLNLGDTYPLKAKTNPPGLPVKWKSSNSRIASVDQGGFVSACGAGSATVSVECQGKQASCFVSVAHLDIKGEYFKVGLNQKMKIPFGNYPSTYPIEWQSTNPSVAFVTPYGELRTFSPGVTVVTASVETSTGVITKEITIEVQNFFEPIKEVSKEFLNDLVIYNTYAELVSANSAREYRVVPASETLPTLYYIRTSDNPFLYTYKVAALRDDIDKFRISHG